MKFFLEYTKRKEGFMKRHIICFLSIICASFAILVGCGSGASDDLVGSNFAADTNVTLTGYIRDGSSNSTRTSSRFRFSLADLSGITVFLEDAVNLYGVTDANGRYSIPNVPQGRHNLIAEKRIGNQIQFRARQENVPVIAQSGSSEVILSESDSTQVLEMLQSDYSLTLVVTDNNGIPLSFNTGLKVNLWGTDYSPNSSNPGGVVLADFPSVEATKAIISAVGYKTTEIPLSFGESHNSEIYVKLPQTTESSNIAPVVAITYATNSAAIYSNYNNELVLYTNRNLDLIATGYDANGDYITYSWTTTRGAVNPVSPISAVFIATESYNATITLLGIDSKGASGKAELNVKFYGGTATGTPEPYNPPPATDTPDPYNPPPATDTIDPYDPPPATDTTDIGSGTTDIGSGTTDIGSDTTDIGSGTTDIGSGTTDIGSGTTDIGSGTTDIGSGTTDIGSGTTDIGSGTTDIGSGTTDIGSGTSEIGSGSGRI